MLKGLGSLIDLIGLDHENAEIFQAFTCTLPLRALCGEMGWISVKYRH